jgi:cytochrome o ubiquinol oxidase subunit 2
MKHSRWVAFAPVLLLSACGLSNAPVLDPQGPIALAERNLLFIAFGVMLIVVIPVFVMAFLFAWRYRASNANARYAPDWSYSAGVEAAVWLVPAAIIVVLSVLVWQATHRLDPYRPIDATLRPLEVDVVALDWKWLFIYPEQQVAVVNELVFPSGRPLSLRITSDTVMNSFYIPALGGQIYAMAGMQTRLNLMADAPGRFMGRNMQYSGRGFSEQQFEATATSPEDFDAWAAKARDSTNRLDAPAYRELAQPGSAHGVTLYSGVEPNLFDTIVDRYGHPACSVD